MECEYAFTFHTTEMLPSGFTSFLPLLIERSRLRSGLCWTGGRGFSGPPEGGVSSGRGRDLYPEQLVSENVPEDGRRGGR